MHKTLSARNNVGTTVIVQRSTWTRDPFPIPLPEVNNLWLYRSEKSRRIVVTMVPWTSRCSGSNFLSESRNPICRCTPQLGAHIFICEKHLSGGNTSHLCPDDLQALLTSAPIRWLLVSHQPPAFLPEWETGHHLVTRLLSLVLNFLRSWSFPATVGQSWAMVVDTVCVVQAFMVPQTLRAPGTLTFSRWGCPGVRPEFGCRGLVNEWWLSLWVSSLVRCGLLGLLGRTVCHLFGCCRVLPRVLPRAAVDRIFSLWLAVAVTVAAQLRGGLLQLHGAFT